ncbi:undecaprenyl/decaprenyl-phosphate alpha-N-acetylglucosaminyl 1-phosphate transferase [Candidatus Peregrinibacteria bacterium]|nr:undecaprenyl/decaprenyl-phosphate alpha-N-acetylglucosaminyl 1-phosphate transferase [Candidatus Peregrinibacteria bacterium]
MAFYYILIAFTVFLLTGILTLAAIKLFPKFGLLDRPEKYGLTRKSIPYYGGLILFAVFLVSALLFLDFDRRLLGVVLAAALMVAVSLWDDYRQVNPWIRLGVQVFSALLLLLFGVGISEIRNPFGGFLNLETAQISLPFGLTLPLLGAIFTVFWVVLITNTLNFLDGLNGLASGVSAIGFTILFVLSVKPAFHVIDQSAFAVISLILAVSAFAFLLFEFAPAKILMGDTGSMFLGFMLATMGIFSGGKIATAFLVLGFPILDAFWVILRRIFSGQSPLKGDLRHLHHRFLQAGFTERQTLLIIYLLCVIFGGIALFLETFEKIEALFALIILMSVLGGLVIFQEKRMTKR